jgi:hypothetical protein
MHWFLLVLFVALKIVIFLILNFRRVLNIENIENIR